MTQEGGKWAKPRARVEPQTEARAGRQGEGRLVKTVRLPPVNPDLPVPSPEWRGICSLR